MNKLLIATTAFVSTFGLSSAYAMGGAEITISGSSKWTYEQLDNDNSSAGQNNSQFKINNNFSVASEAHSDSGLTYGTSVTVDTGGGAFADDGMKLYVKGAFGELRTGSGHAGDSINMDVTASVEGESTNLAGKYRGDSVTGGSDSAITYFTPSINNFSAAVSAVDAGRESKADATIVGLKFSLPVGGSDLAVSYTQKNTSAHGDAVGAGSATATSYGASYSIGNLGLKVAANTNETEDGAGVTDEDSSNLGFGITYKVSDGFNLGLYSVDGEDGDNEGSEVAASVTYTVAPGLSTNLAYTSWDEDDASGTGVAAYIKVAF